MFYLFACACREHFCEWWIAPRPDVESRSDPRLSSAGLLVRGCDHGWEGADLRLVGLRKSAVSGRQKRGGFDVQNDGTGRRMPEVSRTYFANEPFSFGATTVIMIRS